MKRLRRLVLKALSLSLILTATGLLAAVAFVGASLERLSRADLLGDLHLAEPLRIYSADGLLIAELGTERRRPVAFDAIPPVLIQAFLAAEDGRFYSHRGVDPRGLARAALHYLQTGTPSQGGSTITMQVARNFFLTPEKTLERKLAEVLMALQIERTLSKDEILGLYLNKIYFGHRAYGVAAAAELYYGKPLNALTLAESAMLAGIPKAPSAANPVTDRSRAIARRDYVLERMLKVGFIDRTTYLEARAQPDDAHLHERAVELDAGYVAEMARRLILERFGKQAYTTGYRVYTTIDSRLQLAAQGALRESLLAYDRRHGYRGPEARDIAVPEDEEQALDQELAEVDTLPGLTAGIVLSASAREAEVYLGNGERVVLGPSQVHWARPYIDADRRGNIPRRVDSVMARGDLVRLRRLEDGAWELSQRPSVSGALLAIAPSDGAIRSMVGGYSFESSQFNRAIDARRQPGSAFKPFVYAAALAQGWTPASLLMDDPSAVRSTSQPVWRPSNFDHRNLGPIRLRTALTRSRNLASIDLLDRAGLDYVRDFAVRFGFNPGDLPNNLTLTLGTGSVTLAQMATAYAVLANGGFKVTPYLISKVEDSAGDPVLVAEPAGACGDCWFRYGGIATEPSPPARDAKRVLDPRVVFELHSILRDVVTRGTGRRLRELGRSDIAGKTGTTNDVRDAWFCGYQKDLAAVAWMGFDKPAPLGKGETGGVSALGMWARFMEKAVAGLPEATLPTPPGMVKVWVDGKTGQRTFVDGAGAIAEWVRQEDQDYLMGPVPVECCGAGEATVLLPPPIIEDVY